MFSFSGSAQDAPVWTEGLIALTSSAKEGQALDLRDQRTLSFLTIMGCPNPLVTLASSNLSQIWAEEALARRPRARPAPFSG